MDQNNWLELLRSAEGRLAQRRATFLVFLEWATVVLMISAIGAFLLSFPSFGGLFAAISFFCALYVLASSNG